jgi:PAS domain S-box-containing protein
VSSDSGDPRFKQSAGPPAASFDAILDSISEGVFSVDEQWRVTSLNRAAEQLLGISRSEAMGSPCHEVFKTDLCNDSCPLRYTRETGLRIRNHAVQFTNAKGRRIYLRVIGRTGDFIIRGGKNISEPGVEQEVSRHPAVAAAVSMPDELHGERLSRSVGAERVSYDTSPIARITPKT